MCCFRVWISGASLFWALFGLLERQDMENCSGAEETAGQITMAVWLVSSVVILLNMLIAVVTNKFDEVEVR